MSGYAGGRVGRSGISRALEWRASRHIGETAFGHWQNQSCLGYELVFGNALLLNMGNAVKYLVMKQYPNLLQNGQHYPPMIRYSKYRL